MPAKKHVSIKSEEVFSPVGVTCFPNLFETEKDQLGNDTNKFNTMLVFSDTSDLSKVEALIDQVKGEAFPGADDSELTLPIKNNSVKAHLGFPFDKEGSFFKVSTMFKPIIVDTGAEQVIDQNEIYAGCYGRVKVHAFSWDISGGEKGISLRFSGYQKRKEGKRLAGGSSFKAFEDDEGVDDLL